MAESDLLKMRKELLHARETIVDLEEEIRLLDEKYFNLQEEFNKNKEKVQEAEIQTRRIKAVVEENVAARLAQEAEERKGLEKLLVEKNEIIDRLKSELEKTKVNEKQLADRCSFLQEKIDATMEGNFEMQDALKEVQRAKREKDEKEDEIQKLIQQLNELSNQAEQLIGENRALREMANVPANYGLRINEIKLAEREKLEELRDKVRYYESEIHELEIQVAKLKARLRERPKVEGKEGFTEGLSPEQIYQVEEYISKLKLGKVYEETQQELIKENERLRSELAKLQRVGVSTDLERTIERVIQKIGIAKPGRDGLSGRDGLPGRDGKDTDVRDQIAQANAELLNKIHDMFIKEGQSVVVPEKGARRAREEGQKGPRGNYNILTYPPEPMPKSDGNIPEGITYRFGKGPLPVLPIDIERYSQNRINKFEFAFLQLALIESVELHARKDEENKSFTREIVKIEEMLRQLILQRNSLYEDHAKEFRTWEDKKAELEKALEETKLDLKMEKTKNEGLEFKNKGFPESRDAKEQLIIELTKKNSILEVMMMKLSRKYLTLEQEYKLLRSQYMNIEADSVLKEKQLVERIKKLQVWKTKAILEMKYLFANLKKSVPLVRYEKQNRELTVYKEKEWIWKKSQEELLNLKSKQLEMLRGFNENMKAKEEAFEMLEDAENEIKLLSLRLKSKDPQFTYQRSIMDSLISSFKKFKLSPEQAFEEFDKNKDGAISPEEFRSVLAKLRLNFNTDDVKAVMSFLDIDSHKMIKYNSFIRTLKRRGIKSYTKTEDLHEKVKDAIERMGVNLDEFFKIADVDGNNVISRDSMKTAIKAMKLGLTEEELILLIDSIYPKETEGMNYKRFCKKFARGKDVIIKEINEEKDSWMAGIFRRIDNGLYAKKILLYNAFTVNQEQYITRHEFERVCELLQIGLSQQDYIRIYADLDPRGTGNILFSDIVLKIIESKANKNFLEAEKDVGTEDLLKDNDEITVDTLKTKISILEERERIALDRANREKIQCTKLKETLKIASDANDTKDFALKELSTKYFQLKEDYNLTENRLAGSIDRREATEIQGKYQSMEWEINDKDAALMTFRELSETFSQQIRSLELALARKKDEGFQMHRALLDIQSNNDHDNLIGKLYYVVLLSRWQEASTNKKLDKALNEIGKNRDIIYRNEEKIEKFEEEIRTLKREEQSNQLILADLNKLLKETDNDRRDLKKVDELLEKIKELTDSKIDLEIENNNLQDKNTFLKNNIEELEFEKKEAVDFANTLKSGGDRALTEKLIEMSKNQGNLKIAELRANRDAKILKDKVIYLERINAEAAIHTKKLEDEVLALHNENQKLEEEYKTKDLDRQKLFFDQRQKTTQLKKGETLFVPDEELKQLAEKRGEGQKPTATQPGLTAEVKQQLREQEEAIFKLKKELEDKEKLLGKSAQVTGDIEKRIADKELEWEEEKRQMSEVAYNTVKTLESIIDNQAKQIKRKEDIIKSEREKAINDMKLKAKEIEDMQRELSGETQKAIGKLISIGKGTSSPFIGLETSEVGEVEAALKRKDIRLNELIKQVQNMEKEIDNRNNVIKAHENREFEMQKIIEKQQREFRINVTNQELAKVKKELQQKTEDHQELKNELMKLKSDLIENKQLKERHGEDLNSQATKEKEMQYDINKINKQLKNAKAELIKQEKSVNAAQEAVRKQEEEIFKLKKKISLMQIELDEEKKLRVTKDEELAIEKAKSKKAQSRFEEDKRPPVPSALVQQKQSKLEKEIEGLRTELAKCQLKLNPNMEDNFVLNPMTATFEAKDAQEIQGSIYIDEIIGRMKELINEKLSPRKILRAYAKYEPTITELEFLTACSKLGVILPEGSKTILINKLKRKEEDLEFEYEEFLSALKGVLFVRFVDPELLSLGECVFKLNLSQNELANLFSGIGNDGFATKEIIEEGLSKLSKADLSKEKQYIIPRIVVNEAANTYNTITLLKLLEHSAKVYLTEYFRNNVKESQKNMVELFVTLDDNRDRKLVSKEFEKLIFSVNLELKGADLESLHSIFDPNLTGYYDFSLFCDVLCLNLEESIY